jgi:hypothetical protein
MERQEMEEFGRRSSNVEKEVYGEASFLQIEVLGGVFLQNGTVFERRLYFRGDFSLSVSCCSILRRWTCSTSFWVV